ncbi:MAG: hypothetical protein JO056_02740, partial [Alphaproteobacteria bacterium]|nr:hypothetical protein [Alphaproteobacteria bacterium]
MTAPTPSNEEETALAARIARAIGGIGDPVFVGQGSNNRVYRVRRGGEAVALKLCKPHRASFAAEEFSKEQWCAQVARA